MRQSRDLPHAGRPISVSGLSGIDKTLLIAEPIGKVSWTKCFVQVHVNYTCMVSQRLNARRNCFVNNRVRQIVPNFFINRLGSVPGTIRFHPQQPASSWDDSLLSENTLADSPAPAIVCGSRHSFLEAERIG